MHKTTELVTLNNDSLGDVAKGIEGTLVSPPISGRDVSQNFEDIRRFPLMAELLGVVEWGAPTKTLEINPHLTKALVNGNHSSIRDHLPLVWDKLF